MVIKKYLFNKKVLRLGITVTGLALLIIGFLTFYGTNVGNFVMSIDKELSERNIYMSDNYEFTKYETQLKASPVTEVQDITYSNLNVIDALLGEGDCSKKDYVAYSFYITNKGNNAYDIKYEITLYNPQKFVDKAVRVMVVVSNDYEKDKQNLLTYRDQLNSPDINENRGGERELNNYLNGEYKEDEKKEENNNSNEIINPRRKTYKAYDRDKNNNIIDNFNPLLNEKPFFDEKQNIVCREEYMSLDVNQVIKFTVFLWLEGEDPDTNDKVLGGKVKMKMNFTALKKIDEKD